jgi:hypothetical protein
VRTLDTDDNQTIIQGLHQIPIGSLPGLNEEVGWGYAHRDLNEGREALPVDSHAIFFGCLQIVQIRSPGATSQYIFLGARGHSLSVKGGGSAPVLEQRIINQGYFRAGYLLTQLAV